MIVGEQKPLEEIWEMIKDHKKVLVFGCNTCVAVCQQGGNKEAEILASMLRMKAVQEGVDIEITDAGIERQCEHEFFEKAESRIGDADAVLSTACGIGVQFMAEKYPKPIYPGLNTTFLGAVEELGVYTERCQACGQCILARTGGICPITMCAKGLLNGPCGGTNKGKCEISSEQDCAWFKIHERLKGQGRLDSIKKLNVARGWKDQIPRNLIQPGYKKVERG